MGDCFAVARNDIPIIKVTVTCEVTVTFCSNPLNIARHPHSQGSPVRSHSIRGFQQRFFCIAFQESLTFTFPFVNEICIAIPFESDKSTPAGAAGVSRKRIGDWPRALARKTISHSVPRPFAGGGLVFATA